MLNRKKREYARLITRKGANVQRGQTVVIRAELDQPDFITMLVSECYRAGACKVEVEWNHQPLTKLDVHYQTTDSLSSMYEWEYAKYDLWSKKPPVMIYIDSEDPDGLKNLNQVKYTLARAAKAKQLKPYRDLMESRYQWCIAAVPGKKWAKKLFPELRVQVAVDKLWGVILKASRADVDPIAQWNAHNADMDEKCNALNQLDIDALHYTSRNGTDLTVGLMKSSKFIGGSEKTLDGREFNPNIPSEEVFTSPDKNRADGVVYASMPLCYQGAVIEDIRFVFKDGKVTEATASTNNDLLQKLIASDKNACRLGECALVPYDSPIRQTGIMFYNTLFDENAACHLALGQGFPETQVGYPNTSLKELEKRGLNSSVIHVDFMIGTDDMDIDALNFHGDAVPIFKNGLWADNI